MWYEIFFKGKVDDDSLKEIVRKRVQLQNSTLIFSTLAENYDIHESHESNATLNSLGVDSLAAADMAYTFAKILRPPFDDFTYFMQFLLNPNTTVADLYRILTHGNSSDLIVNTLTDIAQTDIIEISLGTALKFRVTERWCWNSSKCIDASPISYNGYLCLK